MHIKYCSLFVAGIARDRHKPLRHRIQAVLRDAQPHLLQGVLLQPAHAGRG